MSFVKNSLALAVLLTGALATTGAGTPDRQSQAPPATHSAANGSSIALASTSHETRPPAIPDSALLQPSDLHGATPTPAPDDLWLDLRPPQPCADHGAYPGSALRRADRAISAVIGVGDRPTVVMEHLATYRAHGAGRYLRELRGALDRCDGRDGPDRRWTVLATGLSGDESVLLRLRENVDYAGEPMIKDSYLAVARVGRAVVVVADVGWEAGSGHPALVRELITPAVRRAASLR